MPLRTMLIDAHVHLYPEFDLEMCFQSAVKNLNDKRIYDDAERLLFLTERADCQFFEELKSTSQIGSFSIEKTPEKETILVKQNGEVAFYIFAGRQVVTREELEVCALCTTWFGEDHQLSVLETIRQIKNAGGLAALNWAPGKWFSTRGFYVRRIIDRFIIPEMVIGDTSMRPNIWPTPRLMRRAINAGIHVLAGSDPLPFSGEELMIGTYATKIRASFDPDKPAASVREILTDLNTEIERIGKRSSTLQFIRRQIKIMAEKKTRKK